ncbi:MAG: oligosaccharide flippase family protein [Saprospiraceae bacterium]|nr:oligosaccharide flippase family protein [Saprospiraceae bacterium]
MASDYNQSFNTIFRWQFLSTVIITVIQLITIVLLGRLLEYKELGAFALFQIIFRFALYCLEPGMFFSIIQKHESNSSLIRKLFSWQFVYLLSSCIVLVFLSLYSETFKEVHGVLLVNCFVILILIGSGSFLHSKLIQQFKQKEIAISQIIAYLFELILVIGLCSFYNPLLVFSYGIIVRYLVFYGMCLIYYYFLAKSSNTEIQKTSTKDHLQQNHYNIASQILSYLQGQYDTFIIISLFGLSTLGGYILTTEISFVIFSKVNPLFNKAILPVVSKSINDKNGENNIISESFTNYFILIALSYCGFWIFRSDLFLLAYPEKVDELSYYASILLPIAFCKALNNIMNSYLLAIGEARKIFYWNVILLVSNYSVFAIFFFQKYELHTFLVFSLLYTILSTMIVSYVLSRELKRKEIQWKGIEAKAIMNIILIIIVLYFIHVFIPSTLLAISMALIFTLVMLYILERKRFLSWLSLSII